MELTHGNLYWKNKEKIKNIYPYVSENISCEVLIIGGGIGGALTAYSLAKEGIDVAIVEKNIIGYGSTMATTALLEYQVDIDLFKLKKQIGERQAKRVYELCKFAIDDIENISKDLKKPELFKRKNAIYFTNSFMQKPQIAREFEERLEDGFDTYLIKNHDTLNMTSGILTKDSSGVIDPYKFTQEIFEYLYTLDNVRIYENTKIIDVLANDISVTSITNNEFKIYSDKVIFTSGFETLKYLNNTPSELYKTFTVVTTPIKELKDMDIDFTARDTADPYHYIRFVDGNRVMYGGEDIKFNEKLNDDKYFNIIANDKYKKLYNSLRKTFYRLEDISIEYAFSGMFANTKDTLPLIDEIENMPNCFCNLGFGANGILYMQIGAEMLKDAINGYYTKDMTMFKINR